MSFAYEVAARMRQPIVKAALRANRCAIVPSKALLVGYAHGLWPRGYTSSAPRFSDKSARDYLAAWVGQTSGERHMKSVEQRMQHPNQDATTKLRDGLDTDAKGSKDMMRLYSIPTLVMDW